MQRVAVTAAAPKPVFRDPVFDGAADPVVIWNRQEEKWFMFYTNRRANADSLDGVKEGAVLEHTLLARDEMANLAWAIEKKVQGVSGEPRACSRRRGAFRRARGP